MRNNWFFFLNLDIDGGYRHIFPTNPNFSQGFGAQFLSQFGSLVDVSLYHTNHFITCESLALQETLSYISKFAGTLFIWSSTRSNFNIFRKLSRNSQGTNPRNNLSSTQIKHATSSRQKPFRLHFGPGSDVESGIPVFFAKIVSSTLRFLWKQVQQNQAFPVLSLAAALVPPFDNLSSKVLADSIPLQDHVERISGPMDDYRSCDSLAISRIFWERDAIEPKTGIKFPTILDSSFGGEDSSHLTTEVLVGTGSRSMRVIKIKTLKVYAFGLYVQPDSVCEKLGKYATVPVDELANRSDFFEDLLREDIHMTVRLVVNCNVLKINTVRDAFEKSLRTRLQKMNPETDYHCLRAFGSYFQQEIPLPMGTTINFRQTVEGQLITEIGGKLIGAVHSKDLCRAFFDMYIGDDPVSAQTKQEIIQNVAGLIRRC